MVVRSVLFAGALVAASSCDPRGGPSTELSEAERLAAFKEHCEASLPDVVAYLKDQRLHWEADGDLEFVSRIDEVLVKISAEDYCSKLPVIDPLRSLALSPR